MAANEEVEEHVHHAHEPFDKMVAGSMAIIAALLAVVSVLGQHFATEELLAQAKSSDTWAQYQAQRIREYSAGVTGELLTQMRAGPDSIAKYQKDVQKYKKQTEELSKEAKDLEAERDSHSRKAGRFHFGEVFLEVAIVFSSLSILTKRKQLFYAGIICGLIGIAIGVTAISA